MTLKDAYHKVYGAIRYRGHDQFWDYFDREYSRFDKERQAEQEILQADSRAVGAAYQSLLLSEPRYNINHILQPNRYGIAYRDRKHRRLFDFFVVKARAGYKIANIDWVEDAGES